MAFDANWAGMFGGGGYNRLRRPEQEEDDAPKPVSIDWSSFERPGPASQRYRQILENAPKDPGPTKGDAAAAGMVGFAQNFMRMGKGDETYENLANRPYHKMMEEFDKNAKLAHESAALENQDRDDMAKVLMGRERAYDRDLGRYMEKKRLDETVRAHDLENLDRDDEREIRRKNIERDNARADENLKVSKGQLDVAGKNVNLRERELKRQEGNDLIKGFTDSTKAILKGAQNKGGKPRRGLSPTQQMAMDKRALQLLAEEHPDFYEDDGEGGKRIKKDISESGRHNLKVWLDQKRKEVEDMWQDGDEDIDEDF